MSGVFCYSGAREGRGSGEWVGIMGRGWRGREGVEVVYFFDYGMGLSRYGLLERGVCVGWWCGDLRRGERV